MAKDPDSPEIRFPLRRSDVAPPPPPPPPPAPRFRRTPAPRPEPVAWRPPPVEAEPHWFEQFESMEPLELTHGLPPPRFRGPPPAPPPPPPAPEAYPEGSYTTNLPVAIRKRRWTWWAVRGLAASIVAFVLAVAWLAFTAPLSKSLEPPAPPSITLLDVDNQPIARRGAVIGTPVVASELPEHVRDAFIAIEDRRFYSHWGVDPRGILRALVHNVSGDGGVAQGGSTITQQLAKNAFLDSSRTVGRKFQEVLIAFWLEAWLTKDEILSRYLSNVYFGDNVYGLRAAAKHYFSTEPEKLTVSQASMLAGLVQAPSRLAPTGNLKGARDRQKLVLGAMVASGFLSKDEAADVRPAVLRPDRVKQLPNGGYFADWVLPQARDSAGAITAEQTVRTTLESRAQKAAERAVRNIGFKSTQIAIVAMHPDGRVIAMVGGNSYADSPFNRATQARRQPGSAFKLFVYLAALRSGMTPDSKVDDTPLKIGDWSPGNSHDSYEGEITLARAFAKSSNVVAARLFRKLGAARVIQAARDLGISTPIGTDATTALGTSNTSLLELTAAYAAVARGSYPVRPTGLAENEASHDMLGSLLGGPTRFPGGQLRDMRTLLRGVVENGTGRGARLATDVFGKTGTTQDNRDALFVGWAGEGEDAVVAGVWVGNDDNSPNAALSGGGIPARVWRDFMSRTLNIPLSAPAPEPENSAEGNEAQGLDGLLEGLGVKLDPGSVETTIDTRPGPGDRIPAPPGVPVPPVPRRDEAVTPPRAAPEDRRPPAPTPTPARALN